MSSSRYRCCGASAVQRRAAASARHAVRRACCKRRGCVHDTQLATTQARRSRADPDQAPDQPSALVVVGAHDDVVHVPGEPGDHHHRHVDDEEHDEAEHAGSGSIGRSAGCRTAADTTGSGCDGRRHREAGQDRQRADRMNTTRSTRAAGARCSGRSRSAPAAGGTWRSGRRAQASGTIRRGGHQPLPLVGREEQATKTTPLPTKPGR